MSQVVAMLLKTWTSGFKTWARWSKDGWLDLISENQRGTKSVRMHLDADEVARLKEFLAITQRTPGDQGSGR